MPGEINPQLLQFLVQKMGNRLTPEMMQGAILAMGFLDISKKIKSQEPKGPPKPKQMQSGGQVEINKRVQGPGPLRSGTTQQQLIQLASVLANKNIGQQLAKMPMVPPRSPSPQIGIPGVKGPQFKF
jgi:hypothetical protein